MRLSSQLLTPVHRSCHAVRSDHLFFPFAPPLPSLLGPSQVLHPRDDLERQNMTSVQVRGEIQIDFRNKTHSPPLPRTRRKTKYPSLLAPCTSSTTRTITTTPGAGCCTPPLLPTPKEQRLAALAPHAELALRVPGGGTALPPRRAPARCGIKEQRGRYCV